MRFVFEKKKVKTLLKSDNT